MATFKPRRITGAWYRHVPSGVPVLDRRAPAADGRWQRSDHVGGLYIADSEDTAWAEWFRWLAEAEIPPRAALPRDMWRLEVDVEVADLSTESELAVWGLPLPTPDRRSWRRFQDVGERAFHEGWPGLVAPSAARPSGLVLCLFWSGPGIDGVEPLPPPEPWDEPPPPPRGMTT